MEQVRNCCGAWPHRNGKRWAIALPVFASTGFVWRTSWAGEHPLKILIFGATGMIGQAVVKEAIAAPHVHYVRLVGRTPAHISDAKAKETIARDFFDLSGIEEDLRGYDACVFCVGVSAAFMNEETYINLSYNLTLSVAATLLRLNPNLVFVSVTGQGADSSEAGPIMWARVKGRTEHALLKTPFKAAYMFRPGAILPLDGIRSKTRLYDFLYRAFGPLQILPRTSRINRMITISPRPPPPYYPVP